MVLSYCSKDKVSKAHSCVMMCHASLEARNPTKYEPKSDDSSDFWCSAEGFGYFRPTPRSHFRITLGWDPSFPLENTISPHPESYSKIAQKLQFGPPGLS